MPKGGDFVCVFLWVCASVYVFMYHFVQKLVEFFYRLHCSDELLLTSLFLTSSVDVVKNKCLQKFQPCALCQFISLLQQFVKSFFFFLMI